VRRCRLFRCHGRVVERFGGRFITGVDVGTNEQDMVIIGRETRYVHSLARCGPPSPWTARGVCRAIQAAAAQRWGSDVLAGDYVVRVLDRAGSVVEEVADSDLKDEWPHAYGVMRSLYIEARRSAKGVDKAIRDILSALEEDDDIPF
jgi:hypothetical protein